MPKRPQPVPPPNSPIPKRPRPSPPGDATCIKTSFAIISDTHGLDFTSLTIPRADVLIHCGDLTEGSKLEEFHTTIRGLKDVIAPLKLVIAGNHDFTLDDGAFVKKIEELKRKYPGEELDELVHKEYGSFGDSRRLFKDAEQDGIYLLDEGTHAFNLENGARLKVYTSPYTPSDDEWGFQYHPHEGHHFYIAEGETDIVITHGPPKGVLDTDSSSPRRGCPDLFAAVARARPRMHCFGHVHSGWGARQVAWREDTKGATIPPNYFNAIDNEDSVRIKTLAGLILGKYDSEDVARTKRESFHLLKMQGHFRTSHCEDDRYPVKHRKNTLFVNAAVKSNEEGLTQVPWLVEINLPKA